MRYSNRSPAGLRPQGALLVGNADEVIEKVGRYNEALGGISRITFMMNAASLPHEKLMHAIELIGTRVAPLSAKDSHQPEYFLGLPHLGSPTSCASSARTRSTSGLTEGSGL